jgi:hypothetical protein
MIVLHLKEYNRLRIYYYDADMRVIQETNFRKEEWEGDRWGALEKLQDVRELWEGHNIIIHDDGEA